MRTANGPTVAEVRRDFVLDLAYNAGVDGVGAVDDAKATQARYDNAVKRRNDASACYRHAKMTLHDSGEEEEKDYADQVMARLLPELSAVETFLLHEAAHCWDKTKQAKEQARQQKDVAKAMGKGKA